MTVGAAFNRAADEIIEALELPGEGKRDLVNLVVNVGMHYLDWPNDDLTAAIEASYSEDATSVLDWCRR